MKKNKDDQDQKLTEAGNLLKAIPTDRKNFDFFPHQVQDQLGYFPEELVLKAASYFSVFSG